MSDNAKFVPTPAHPLSGPDTAVNARSHNGHGGVRRAAVGIMVQKLELTLVILKRPVLQVHSGFTLGVE